MKQHSITQVSKTTCVSLFTRRDNDAVVRYGCLGVEICSVMPGNWFAAPRDLVDNHGSEAVGDQLRRSYAAGHKLDVEVLSVSAKVRGSQPVHTGFSELKWPGVLYVWHAADVWGRLSCVATQRRERMESFGGHIHQQQARALGCDIQDTKRTQGARGLQLWGRYLFAVEGSVRSRLQVQVCVVLEP